MDGFFEPQFIHIYGREIHLVVSDRQAIPLGFHMLFKALDVGLGSLFIIGYNIAAEAVLVGKE